MRWIHRHFIIWKNKCQRNWYQNTTKFCTFRDFYKALMLWSYFVCHCIVTMEAWASVLYGGNILHAGRSMSHNHAKIYVLCLDVYFAMLAYTSVDSVDREEINRFSATHCWIMVEFICTSLTSWSNIYIYIVEQILWIFMLQRHLRTQSSIQKSYHHNSCHD